MSRRTVSFQAHGRTAMGVDVFLQKTGVRSPVFTLVVGGESRLSSSDFGVVEEAFRALVVEDRPHVNLFRVGVGRAGECLKLVNYLGVYFVWQFGESPVVFESLCEAEAHFDSLVAPGFEVFDDLGNRHVLVSLPDGVFQVQSEFGSRWGNRVGVVEVSCTSTDLRIASLHLVWLGSSDVEDRVAAYRALGLSEFAEMVEAFAASEEWDPEELTHREHALAGELGLVEAPKPVMVPASGWVFDDMQDDGVLLYTFVHPEGFRRVEDRLGGTYLVDHMGVIVEVGSLTEGVTA